MATDPINVFTDLQPVYGEGARGVVPLLWSPLALFGVLTQISCMHAATETARKRYETIKDAFQERFGAAPEAYTRSPGAWGQPMA